MKKSPDRPGEFLREGRRLFVSKGFGSTTIEDIVTAVGVGKGTFYSYFRDKADLLLQLIHQSFLELAACTHARRARARTPEQHLEYAFRAQVDYLRQQPDLLNILEQVKIPYFDQINTSFVQAMKHEIAELVQQIEMQQRSGRWRSICPHNLLGVMMVSIHVLLIKELKFGCPVQPSEIRDVLAVYLHGLSIPTPAPAPRRKKP